MSIPDAKRCNRCGETRPNSDWHRSKRRYDGLAVYCKLCMAEYQKSYYSKPENRERISRASAERYAGWSDEKRAAYIAKGVKQRRAAGHNLKCNYGLSLKDYEDMLVSQGGGCAVCGREPGDRRLHVDHDHACCAGKKSCGKCVRGLLCVTCNVWLGFFENAEWVESVEQYLDRYSA